MRLRIYVDTSVIGGCCDEQFASWSKRLFKEFDSGAKRALISDITQQELEGAPLDVKKVLKSLSPEYIEFVSLTYEAEQLAAAYLKAGAVPTKDVVDAQHIAIATVERADVLVSWNFKQIVNLNRIHAFNAVNLKLGYPLLEIRSPQEVVDVEKI